MFFGSGSHAGWHISNEEFQRLTCDGSLVIQSGSCQHWTDQILKTDYRRSMDGGSQQPGGVLLVCRTAEIHIDSPDLWVPMECPRRNDGELGSGELHRGSRTELLQRGRCLPSPDDPHSQPEHAFARSLDNDGRGDHIPSVFTPHS